MVTFAQAQERAEEWINGDVPAYQHREVRVREFGLGFVVWGEDRAEGPRSDAGAQRLVIARDSGEATLWPALPVGEVIRRYEEEYGREDEVEDAVPAPAARVDLNQTSFLLSPPEWLQEAADRLGIEDRRPSGEELPRTQAGLPVPEAREPVAEPSDAVPEGATPWAGTDTNGDAGEDRSVPLPATVFAPQLSDADDVAARPDAETALMAGGSQLPPTALNPAFTEEGARQVVEGGARQVVPPPLPPYGDARGPAILGTPPPVPPGHAPVPPPAQGVQHTPVPPPPAPGASAYGHPQAPGGAAAPVPPPVPPVADPVAPGRPLAPHAGDIADAATSKAGPPLRRARGGAGAPPPPPSAPGVPGVPHMPVPPPPAPGVPGGPGVPGAPGAGGAYVPTQLVSAVEPGVAGPPVAPAAPGGAVHHAETVLAGPAMAGPGVPPPPPQGVLPPQGAAVPGQRPPAYGYPPQGQPTVGPGYQAVLRYRAQDGSEQQLIRRSAPGMPHPEWQIFHELRALNVPPDQVLELHTELESCVLPGGYCARMIREQWPQARITSIAPYGTDHASRQQGMGQLLAHQGELHQVADGPARPAPVRVPVPPVAPVPQVAPEGIAQELASSFGPGVFRFEQAAVSRQGVPPVVAHMLVVAGLPLDMGPFFWAQAQPGRPVPTLAELAQERGVRPGPDAGSYLVMGSDFGKAICVQYGTANIVAVPVEAGPGGAAVPPQFVNTGLPEFARCLALLGRMWRLRFGLNQEQAGRWTVDFQAQLASLDPVALASPESWWSVLLEQMWDGLL